MRVMDNEGINKFVEHLQELQKDYQNEEQYDKAVAVGVVANDFINYMENSDFLHEHGSKEVRIEISDNEVAVYDVDYEKSKARRKILEPYLVHIEDWNGFYIRDDE